MKRIVLAAALAALGVTAVLAQSNPIAARKALMKGNNDNASNLVKMTRGEQPYDAAKVNAAFAQWADTAQKLPSLFPDNSKEGDQTRATAKIWETRSDFDAKVAAFAKAVADNRDKAKNVDDLKIALGAVGKACDGCHEQYRKPAQR
ncbi:cytochrome c [Sphingomonas sp.]|uniref:c-type cytochrome n=1 Tax=Sphingomonas sp. TaxID=28214 RepID=UPI00286AB94A|nr:cytochrome c [Sphingomonas sp.]